MHAASTAIAGILHHHLALIIVVSNVLSGTFFIVAGIAQIFWAVPMVARWGRTWYYIGIAGTLTLIILWAITRFPNPIIAGRALPINETGIAIEVFQIAYIVITSIIVAKEGSGSKR
jgi:hypothetical protein